jgi:16S rRNA (guanine527-N7)-methyltransferase
VPPPRPPPKATPKATLKATSKATPKAAPAAIWSPAALAADRARALAQIEVSRETLARLDTLVNLLLKTQEHTNLVASSTLNTLWTRHIVDSLQLLHLAPETATTWVDLGSGGGFPGLVLACALKERPDARVILVESTGKKARFLQTCVDALQLPALVHAGRIEDFVRSFSDSVDVVTARALAPLPKLLDLAEPLLKRGAQGLFPKGQDVAAELTESAKYWSIESTLVPSRTSEQGRILVVRQAERRR